MKITIILLLLLSLMLVGCAPENEYVKRGQAGFWSGLWDGITAPFAWFCSLFTRAIDIYECNNNGGWYDFGFVLGAGIIFGGGCSSSSKKS